MITGTLQPNTEEHQVALHNMGIDAKLLKEIGTRILASYNQATPNDAANAAGTYAYLAAVKAGRDVLRAAGWSPLKANCLEFTVQRERKLLLLVSSGDKNTGCLWEVEPKTKNPKGNQTRNVVKNNAKQLSFPFLSELEPQDQPLVIDSMPTWFLLYHINPVEGMMRMEISLPVGFNPEEFCIDGWRKRIVLSPIEFNPAPSTPEPDFATDFEIGIKRKAL